VVKVKITRVLTVVMITQDRTQWWDEHVSQDNGQWHGGRTLMHAVNEGVVGIVVSLSLQSSSLQQKEGRQLLRIMIKDSHHITEMISWTIPEEPMHVILLSLKMPMQDSQTVT
jgi:hypothetical protein